MPINCTSVFQGSILIINNVLSASMACPTDAPSASPLGNAPLCWWLKAHWRWDWDLPHAVQEGKRSWHTQSPGLTTKLSSPPKFICIFLRSNFLHIQLKQTQRALQCSISSWLIDNVIACKDRAWLTTFFLQAQQQHDGEEWPQWDPEQQCCGEQLWIQLSFESLFLSIFIEK